MKKFLLSVLFVTAIGYFNQSKAQCAGANVTVFNIVFDQNGTVFNWSFDWIYNQGNASIQVVYKCGGAVVGEEPCIKNLNDFPGGSEAGSFDFATVTCGINLAKEVEIRIYSSSNCNGTFCPVAQSAPLPVTFASFTAARAAGNVNVTWATSSEQNNAGFAVQRNSTGKWETVGFVPSQAINGNSDSYLSYNFTDANNSVRGISQYRIVQADLDGKTKISEIRSVRGEGQTVKVTVYPNPSTDGKVNVVFDEAKGVRNVSVVDMSGRTIRQMNGITNNNITIENLTSGIYTIRVQVPETGAQTVEKIIVNKR